MLNGDRMKIGWVYYRTTQLREDLKVANEIKAFKVRAPIVRDIWSKFQNDLIKQRGEDGND